MASSDINLANSDILTCSICLEIFTKPKYLPCLHTFCEGCISTYITSWFENGDTKSIDCPLCRGKVPAPKENCQSKEWAEMLPLNFLISGLIESQKITRAEKMCMLCERFGGETVAKASFVCVQCADTLCETCEKYHKSIKVSADHDVRPLDGAFSFSDLALDTFKGTCNDHAGKSLELYCSDHDEVCCSICISINHRKCETVTTLVDAAKGISSSTRVQELQRDLANVKADLENVIGNQKSNLKQFENQFEVAKKNVEEIFKNLRDKLDQQEELRKFELSKVFNEKKSIIEKTITMFENKRNSVENEQKILDLSVGKASDVQLMIELKKLENRRDKHKEDLSSIAKSQEQKFELTLKNDDKSTIEKQITETCIIQCDTKPCAIKLSSINVKMCEIVRFPIIGTDSTCWVVKSKPDAISFSVSEAIFLCGFISYGGKNSSIRLAVQATVKRGSETLGKIKISFAEKEFQNHVTKLYLEKPIDISPGVLYDVVFIMNGTGLCNYGKNGKKEVICEGVLFKFSKSVKDTNSTSVESGQIPGFLFRKKSQ